MAFSYMYTDKDNTIYPDHTAKCSAIRKRKVCQIEPKFMKPEFQELCELSIGDEWKNCKKPQGHGGFLPWQKFLEDPKSHLCKAGINDDVTTVDYLKTSGALVVRLTVGFVSRDRPEELYKSLFKHCETHHTFLGSGAVIHVEPSSDRCRCCKCVQRTGNVKTWNVYISTATHVVFDHSESVWTTAELFHDSESRTSVNKVFINCVEERSIIGDTCVLKGVTCDEELSLELTELFTKQKQLYDALPLCERPIAVIISHPHGMYKHISWGHCHVDDKKQDQMFCLSSYKYNATTCPGSSGAPVFILNDRCKARYSSFFTCNFPSHSGSNSRGNYSVEMKEPTLKAESNIKINRKKVNEQPCSANDAEMCYGGEGDLHKHVTGCKKNPGHRGFIPLKDFNNSCLPKRYRDSDVMLEYIQTLAAVSGQCKTKFTSLERQEFYPDTEVPYPCYKDRGSHVMRLGTCCIKSVVVRQKNSLCRCSKCQFSATPSKVNSIIYVACASHLVFDDSEARQTRIVLGFDDNKSSGVSLDGWEYVDGDVEADSAILQHETCDLELADELSKMLKRLYYLEQEVSLKYLLGDVDKLTVIISHPHGCPKQVSVGQWTHKHQSKDVKTYDNINCRFWYTASTCPGSSGAAVYVLGQECSHITKCHIPTHVHSDNVGDGWNKSGYGVDNLDTQQRNTDKCTTSPSTLEDIGRDLITTNSLNTETTNTCLPIPNQNIKSRNMNSAIKKSNTRTHCPSYLRRVISKLRGLF